MEIVSDYSNSGIAVGLGCYLGDDLDLTDYLESGDYSIDASSSPAWTFAGNIAGRLPLRYRNAPLRLVGDFGGIEMELLHARAALPIQNTGDYTTQLIAGTPGMFLDKSTLDQQVIFNAARPETVLRNAVYRVPYYDRARISIAPFDTPRITRGLNVGNNSTGSSDAFTDEQTPMDIISSIVEEVDLVFFDTALAGFVAIKNPGVGEGQPMVWDYDVDSPEVLEPFDEPIFATPDEQYTRVIVRDKFEDGTYRIYEEWPVDYSSLTYPPATSRSLYLPFSDVTTPDAWQQARQLGVDTARRLEKGVFNGSITVAFNPFLEPFDLITIYDEHEDDSGRYRRGWQCVLEGVSHTFGDGISSQLSFMATILRNERIPDDPIVIEPLSTGVTSISAAGFALGLDYLGEWVDDDHITGARWAGEDGSGAEPSDWFDPAVAPAGLFGEEMVDGVLLDYIDYVSAAGATYGEDEVGEWVDDQYISDPQWSGTVLTNFDSVSLDWFDYDYAPLGLLGEDGTGEFVDF